MTPATDRPARIRARALIRSGQDAPSSVPSCPPLLLHMPLELRDAAAAAARADGRSLSFWIRQAMKASLNNGGI